MRLDLSSPVLMLAAAETIIWAALFYSFPILLLRWEADFGWSRGDVALAFTLALATSALASPLAGRLIDRGLSRWTFPGAAALGGAALFGLSRVETIAGFYAGWMVIGLACSACLYEPCFAFITRRKGAAARGAITTVTLVAGFASSLCFPIADALADAYGWRLTLAAFAAAAIGVAAPLFAAATRMMEGPGGGAAERAKSGAANRAFLRKPAFWLLAAAFPALALTHGMTISHLIPVLEDRGAGAGFAVLAASLIGPCQVAGRVVITLVAANRSAAAMTVISFFAVALSGVLMLFAASEPAILAAVILFGAGYGVLSIVKPVVTADFLGREGFGAISGSLALPYIACAAAAPFLASIFWARGGYDLMLMVGVALAVVGIALIAAARRLAKIDPGGQER